MGGSRPNILIYISHDTGRFISPYGVKTVRTPNADRLAGEGVTLDRLFCTAPQCSPSRASLFTGRFPHQTGVMGLCNPGPHGWDLNDNEIHAARYFADLGYDTGLIGIAHETKDKRERLGYRFIHGERNAPRVGVAMTEFLDSRAEDQPFFLSIGTFETHRPFDYDGTPADDSLGVTVPPPLHDTPDTRADFAAMQGLTRRWDQGLGDVLDILDQRGLADDTLVLVTTDHGLAMPRAKCTLYDPGIEVLGMLRWPGRIPAGERRDALLSNVDVLPTLLEAAGAEAGERIEGRGFLPLLIGGDYTPNERVFAEKTYHSRYDPTRAVRTDRFKYVHTFERQVGCEVPGDAMSGSAYPDNIDLSLTPQQRPVRELYDLEADPLEMNNVAGQPEYAEACREMAAALREWMRRTRDPLLDGPISSPFRDLSLKQLAGT